MVRRGMEVVRRATVRRGLPATRSTLWKSYWPGRRQSGRHSGLHLSAPPESDTTRILAGGDLPTALCWAIPPACTDATNLLFCIALGQWNREKGRSVGYHDTRSRRQQPSFQNPAHL